MDRLRKMKKSLRTLRFALLLIISALGFFNLSGCTTLAVTEQNRTSFGTPELCVYAYKHSLLKGWKHDDAEWATITSELRARGYQSANDCSAFSYALKECDAPAINKDSNLYGTCLTARQDEYISAEAAVLNRGKIGAQTPKTNHTTNINAPNVAEDPLFAPYNELLRQWEPAIRCTSTTVGSITRTNCN